MSEYYRALYYVPYNGRTAYVRQPSSGELWISTSNPNPPYYEWTADAFFNACSIAWDNTFYGGIITTIIPYAATTYSEGGSTFYRGTLRETVPFKFGNTYKYAIYRDVQLYGAINTGVPSGGLIRFSQLYGAQNYTPGFMGGINIQQFATPPINGTYAYYLGQYTITATATVYPNGTVIFSSNSGNPASQTGNWGLPTGSPSAGVNYWGKLTRIGTGIGNAALVQANSTPTTGWIRLDNVMSVSVSTYQNGDTAYQYLEAYYTLSISTDSAGADIISSSIAFGLLATQDPPP
jgi:hypothetical protein